MEQRSLRVGITCFPLIGGSGILATALGTELAARGHEVHFFSYAKPVRLDLSTPGVRFHEVAVGEHSVFPCPDYTLPLAVMMAEVGRAERLELFHAHYAVPHATAAFLATEMIGNSAPRIVTTLHGTDTTLLGQNPQYQPAIAHALTHSHAVTAVSESLKQQTIDTFKLSRPVDVIGNFFTPGSPTRTRHEVRRDFGISDNEFMALHMSNLRPTKRIDLLLQIIAAMKRRSAIKLVILAGSSFEPYQHLVHELGVRENVIVSEATEPVENYLHACDAGVYTSEVESFGLSILESMFFAKPVVAFRTGGIPEVLGDSGLLHDFGDVTAMATALDKLIESPKGAAQLGEAARRRAESMFTADKAVPQYEAIYRRVLGRN